MTPANNEVDLQLNKLQAELNASRRQLQAEINARQKAEKNLRDFAASRNIKILQATEEALRSAWVELEEQRLLIKEQRSRINYLEACLANRERSDTNVAEGIPAGDMAEPTPAEEIPAGARAETPPVEAAPAAMLPVAVKAQDQYAYVQSAAPGLEISDRDRQLVVEETDTDRGDAAAGKMLTGSRTRPWYLERQVFDWLTPASEGMVTVSAAPVLDGNVNLPGYSWHESGPAPEPSARVNLNGLWLPLPVLKSFIDEESGLCALILQDVNEERLADAEKGARRLRQAARAIGAGELEKCAGEVESLLIQGEERIFVLRCIVEMANSMKSLLEDIAAVLEGDVKKGRPVTSDGSTEESAMDMLNRLGQMLADGNDEARAYLDEHGSILADLLESEEWEDFLHYVRTARYDRALQMIEYYL